VVISKIFFYPPQSSLAQDSRDRKLPSSPPSSATSLFPWTHSINLRALSLRPHFTVLDIRRPPIIKMAPFLLSLSSPFPKLVLSLPSCFLRVLCENVILDHWQPFLAVHQHGRFFGRSADVPCVLYLGARVLRVLDVRGLSAKPPFPPIRGSVSRALLPCSSFLPQ